MENIAGRTADEDYLFIDPESADVQQTDITYSKTDTRQFTAEFARHSIPDDSYCDMLRSLSAEQYHVHEFVNNWCLQMKFCSKTNSNVQPFLIFLTGGAGVGKSHAIRALYHTTVRSLRQVGEDPDDLLAILTAPTGTAAYNIGGMTLHSAFLLPCKKANYQTDTLHKLSQERRNTLRCKLQTAKLLIIDEISMVSSQTLHNVHLRLQEIMGVSDPHVYFGSLSVLAVGDLMQLPPVGRSQVFTPQSGSLARLHGSLWQNLFTIVELTVIFRQQGDPIFTEILNRIRTGDHTEHDVETLNSQMVTPENPAPTTAFHIFPLRRQVEGHNQMMLSSLSGSLITVPSRDSQKDRETSILTITTPDDIHQTAGLHKDLLLKVGARVSLTRNIDVTDGLANGAQGTVVDVSLPPHNPLSGRVFVQFDKEDVGLACRNALSSALRQQHAVPVKAETCTFDVGHYGTVHVSRTQFPLTLCWAATIHKVQGASLDQVVVDFEEAKRVQCGQTYVALGRSKTLSGLFVKGLTMSKIHVNKKAVQEMLRLRHERQLTWYPPTMNPLHQSHVRLVHLNCRSVRRHMADIQCDLKLTAATVLCLTETHLLPANDTRLSLVDFTMLHQKQGHGISVATHHDAVSVQLQALVCDHLEYVSVVVDNNSTSVIVTTVYRPPSSSLTQLLPLLETALLHPSSCDTPSVVFGDFNVDASTQQYAILSEFMSARGYCQIVTQPKISTWFCLGSHLCIQHSL